MNAYGSQAHLYAWFCNVAEAGIPVADCVLIFVLATLFGAANMSPGGLGAMEASLVFRMIERGVDDSPAIFLAVAIRLVTLWFGMMMGGASLLISNKFPAVSSQAIQKACL